MKLFRCAGAAGVFVLALFAAARLVPSDHVRAQSPSGCALASIFGSYGYTTTGFYANNGTAFFSAVGVFTADGNGNLTATDNASQNGAVAQRQLVGTYQVTPACTGTMQFSMGGQAAGNLAFVLVRGGAGVRYMQVDGGTVITGTAEQQ